MHIPTHEDIHRNCKQIEYGTHSRDLGEQIACRGVKSGPRSKFLLKEGIGRHLTSAPIEGYEIFGCHIAGNGNAEGENKGVPVAGECLAWIADVADA